jgi:hypothetical protein
LGLFILDPEVFHCPYRLCSERAAETFDAPMRDTCVNMGKQKSHGHVLGHYGHDFAEYPVDLLRINSIFVFMEELNKMGIAVPQRRILSEPFQKLDWSLVKPIYGCLESARQ